MIKTKNITLIAVLVSLASVIHAVEMVIPNPLPLPGAKLGLANVVTLVALLLLGFKKGMLVSVMRVILGSLISGTFMSVTFVMSLSGALFSTVVMYLFIKYAKSFSTIGVSVVGAVAHNIAQLITAYFVVSTGGIFFYLPFLLVVGVPVGIFTGAIAKNVYSHLKKLNIY